MKFLPIAALVLAGCGSHPEMVDIAKAAQQGASRTLGATAEPGSVASGGTGYLPLRCAGAQAAATTAVPECK